jgi:ribosomal protein S27E
MPAAACAQRPRAPAFIEPAGYAQHRPESTVLYQLVEQHYPEFRELRAREGRSLPDYVQEEFDAYLKCGRLEEGFLRVRCEGCHAEKLVAFSCKRRGFCPSCGGRRMVETAALLADEVLPERPLRQWVLSLPFALRFLLATDPDSLTRVLRTVYRTISGFLLRKAGLTRDTGHPGAVTLIQRFGSALNLNIHFHMIFLDGVYLPVEGAAPVFRHVPAPTGAELQELVQRIAAHIGKVLEQRGLIERDMESAWLAMQGEGGPLDDLIGHSITYRIAVGARAGQKLFTLQTVPAREPEAEQQGDGRGAANAAGFSLHAGLDIQPHQREKLERLCRYVSRPPIAVERLALTSSGQVRYALKTPYRDGTTHIVLEPLDLIARLAALVPPPRMHLTRFHGVFAPHSKLRAGVTPAHRGVGSEGQGADQVDPEKPNTPRHVALSWARRLKRVFGIDISTCARCGGQLKVIASIEEPAVIGRILAHLEKTALDPQHAELPLGARAPPRRRC